MSAYFGLLSVGSGNFLDFYETEAEARRLLIQIALGQPEAINNVAVVPFDAAGEPSGEAITVAVTKCQGEVTAFTVPAPTSRRL